VEEYTREFEQCLLKCDLREDETQTLVRYLTSLDDQVAHVIELLPYSCLDDLSSLAYKVKQQRKAKGKGIVSDGDQAPNGQVNVPSIQPCQEKSLRHKN